MGIKDDRKEALMEARRKFLQITSGMAGATLLAACGGAFVKPVRKNNNTLRIELAKLDKNLVYLMGSLESSTVLRKEFALRPIEVMQEYGVVAPKVAPSVGERLLLYVTANDALGQRLLDVTRDSKLYKNIRKIAAKGNLTLHEYLQTVNTAIESEMASNKGIRLLETQAKILLDDPVVRDILELSRTIDAYEISQMIRGQPAADGAHDSPEAPPGEPEFCNFPVCVYVVLIGVVAVAVKYAAAVHVVYKYNIAKNVNALTDGVPIPGGLEGETPSIGSGADALHQWDQFAELLRTTFDE